MVDFYFFSGGSPSPWKDLIPLISPAVVITLFIIDRVIAGRYRRKEVERSWYLKVLIEPIIPKISEFYKKVNERHEASYNLLMGAQDNSTHSTFVNMVAKEIGIFQSLKREFESEVIFPIQMRYPAIGRSLTDVLLDLEDKYSESFNAKTYSEDERNDFRTEISKNRSFFLNLLYAPIEL